MSGFSSRLPLDRIGGQALTEVLETWPGLPVVAVSPMDRDASAPEAEEVIVRVPLRGKSLDGLVQLRFPRAFAQQALARLDEQCQSPPPQPADADDFARELGNMVAGRVAAGLGIAGCSCALGIPTVCRPSPGPLPTGCRPGFSPLPAAPAANAGTADPPSQAPPPAAPLVISHTRWTCQGHRLTLEIRLHPRAT
ncbi:MAG: chemotaxis protein CheX [Parvularculaceae bacterium]|nr:chemotaxis protein CheX [Parvularculaceae bacterium]